MPGLNVFPSRADLLSSQRSPNRDSDTSSGRRASRPALANPLNVQRGGSLFVDLVQPFLPPDIRLGNR